MFSGENQILIDRHGHTLSHQLPTIHSLNEKQINEYAQKLITLGQDDELLRSKGILKIFFGLINLIYF